MEQTTGPKLVSKNDWLSKVIGHYGQPAQMRVVYQWPVAQFKGLMGEPSSTQTVDSETFWYYECSDGTIQLSLDTGNLSIGRMAGKINDY